MVTLCAAADDAAGLGLRTDQSCWPHQSVRGHRVTSANGTPVPLTQLGAGEATHRWPQILPGGRAVLYAAHSAPSAFDEATIALQHARWDAKVVQRGGHYGRYLRSGHLVYIHQGILFAKSFDLAVLEPTGQPVPVIQGISTYPGLGGAGAGSFGVPQTWPGPRPAPPCISRGAMREIPGEGRPLSGWIVPVR